MKKVFLLIVVPLAFACSSKKAEDKTEEIKSNTIEAVDEEVMSSEAIIEKKTEELEKKAEELDKKVDNLINNL